MTRFLSSILGLAAVASFAIADGPADNIPEKVRRVPALGIELKPADRAELEAGLGEFDSLLAKIKAKPSKLNDLLPDVLIYRKAVADAIKYQEFFAPGDVPKGKEILKEGLQRAKDLLDGKAPWTEATGLVVRGYKSKLDDSVQPFGLVIPENYTHKTSGKYRLDLWFHGRGEVLSEVNFIADRRRNVGTFAPADTIVLHPYGRYCNANKFAGEVDVLEALEAAKKMYRVDEDRISARGFSMGGASAWQFAVHYPSMWFAANPGAGFSETPRFLNVFQRETLQPTWFEKKLWNMHDCDKWAANLKNCPTVAYSGELDSQKQAADVMEEALKPHGIALTHVIGPKTKHAYHPAAKAEVDDKMAALALKGRNKTPKAVDFTTYTLKYNKSAWVQVDAVEEHWSEARIRANLVPLSQLDGGKVLGIEVNPLLGIKVNPSRVTAFTLSFGPGTSPFPVGTAQPTIQVGELNVVGPPVGSDGSWTIHVKKSGNKWISVATAPTGKVKRHELQGPIDDALMSRFLFVLPSGTSKNTKVEAWVKAESARAISEWRKHFRGEARVKKDVDVTPADIADSNLILWGDPESNAVLKKIADKLAIGWSGEAIKAGDKSFAANDHALIEIEPNPLNPEKYVVLNSGFTFREYDYLNNARQVSKLPDWAVIDLNTPPNSRFPGKIVAADFFDEVWGFKTSDASKP